MSENLLPLFEVTPLKLSLSVLPKKIDILRAIDFEKKKANSKQKQAQKIVAKKVFELWQYISIPSISIRTIEKKIEKLTEEYRLASKNIDRSKKVQDFVVS